jgi:hypothetical protein
LGYPVLFAYRHTLELYLKLIGEIGDFIHSFKDCILRVEKRDDQRIPSPVREWIIDFDNIDPGGTAFRYADDRAGTLKYADSGLTLCSSNLRWVLCSGCWMMPSSGQG